MKYVALLRGINVGGNKKVEMKKLKEIFESLNFQNVLTYINSGNVIFDSKNKPQVYNIEKAISEVFDFNIQVVLRDKTTIEKINKEIPKEWKNNKDEKTDVLFLWEDSDNEQSIDLISKTDVDTLKYIEGSIVWHIKKKDYNKSGINKFIGTEIYKNMTARNINTVRKILELMS
jgi:uncharacterized protein (DUF1697 family)